MIENTRILLGRTTRRMFFDRSLRVGVLRGLILTFGIVISLFVLHRFICAGFSCIHFPEKSAWVVTETYENTRKIWRGLLVHPDHRIIRLELVRGVNKSQADEFTKIRLMNIAGLYDTVGSPYPGAVSSVIRCDDAYKPHPVPLQASDGTQVTYFVGTLNDRLQYGVCVDSQIAYTSYVGMLYCAHTQIWANIELIVDDSKKFTDTDGRQFIGSVLCRE